MSQYTNRQVCACAQNLADKAADKGITIGLEVVNRYETNVMNTTTAAMELLADIDRPAMTVHLDSYHANIEELSMAAAVEACADRLGCAPAAVSPQVALSGTSLSTCALTSKCHCLCQ